MQGTWHSSLLRNIQTTPWKFNGTIKVSFQKQLFQDTNGIKCSIPIDSQCKLGIWLPFMPLKNSLLIFTVYNLPSETALSLKINRLWSSWEFEELYILKNSPRNAVYLVREKSCSLFCPELFMQLHAQIREPKHSPLQLINGSKGAEQNISVLWCRVVRVKLNHCRSIWCMIKKVWFYLMVVPRQEICTTSYKLNTCLSPA